VALKVQSMMSNQNVPVVARNAKSFRSGARDRNKGRAFSDAPLMSQAGNGQRTSVRWSERSFVMWSIDALH